LRNANRALSTPEARRRRRKITTREKEHENGPLGFLGAGVLAGAF
jgi:hypothetical protein